MLFLIRYNRLAGKIETMEEFDDRRRDDAEEARLRLELELNSRGLQREVVLLEAADEAALRRTHRRYFEGIRTLATG